MKLKLLILTVLSLMILQSTFAHPGKGKKPEGASKAEGSKPAKGTKHKKQHVKLTVASGFEAANISSMFAADPTKDKTAIAHLNGKVRVVIPTASLDITATNASIAEIHYVLSKSGVDYADCTLAYDANHSDLSSTTNPHSEYKLDVELKKGGQSVRSKKGSCDIDLTTAGIQTGIPTIATSDVVRAEVLISGSRLKFAEGTL